MIFMMLFIIFGNREQNNMGQFLVRVSDEKSEVENLLK